jgi:O-antigen ligase
MTRVLQCCAAFIIVQAMSALAVVDRILYGEWDAKGGDKFTTLSNLILIASSLFLLISGERGRERRILNPIPPLLVVGLLFASAVWSMDPSATVRRSINYAALVAGAMGMARALSIADIMKTTLWVTVVAAVISLALWRTPLGVLVNVEAETMDFRGVFGHKNMLGEAMVAGVLSSLYLIRIDKRGRMKDALFIALFMVVILASRSATSLIVCLFYMAALAIMVMYAKGGIFRLFSVLMVITTTLMIAIFVCAPEILFEALGKDPTLTGRTGLWPYVIDMIWYRPLLGWGFNGFWVPTNQFAVTISDTVGWYVPEAHNGLLEILLQLGFIGTGLFLWLMVRTAWLAIRCIHRGNADMGRVTLVFLAGLLIMAVSEAILLTPSQIPTLQFFLFAFMCESDLSRMSSRSRTSIGRAPSRHHVLAASRPVTFIAGTK